MVLNVIIFGPQGAGKGTQAKLLAHKYNLEHLEAGRILRDIVSKGGELADKISDYLVKGLLVPTDFLFREVLKPKLGKVDIKKGLVFDGVPRRLEEALLCERLLAEMGRKINYVFYIKISEKETYQRLGKRLTCRQCKRPFISGVDVESIKEQCPQCGGKLYQRDDDTRAAIAQRLRVFKEETLPVIKHYRKKGVLFKIDGEQSIDQVHLDIVQKIEKPRHP